MACTNATSKSKHSPICFLSVLMSFCEVFGLRWSPICVPLFHIVILGNESKELQRGSKMRNWDLVLVVVEVMVRMKDS